MLQNQDLSEASLKNKFESYYQGFLPEAFGSFNETSLRNFWQIFWLYNDFSILANSKTINYNFITFLELNEYKIEVYAQACAEIQSNQTFFLHDDFFSHLENFHRSSPLKKDKSQAELDDFLKFSYEFENLAEQNRYPSNIHKYVDTNNIDRHPIKIIFAFLDILNTGAFYEYYAKCLCHFFPNQSLIEQMYNVILIVAKWDTINHDFDKEIAYYLQKECSDKTKEDIAKYVMKSFALSCKRGNFEPDSDKYKIHSGFMLLLAKNNIPFQRSYLEMKEQHFFKKLKHA